MATDLDLIELLERDHRRIDDLAERLDATTDDQEIRDLFRQIVDGLVAHEAIENQVLFPAFRAMVATTDHTVDARSDEHDELNDLLDEMLHLDSSGHAFIKRGSALLLELEGHFEREEESVFAPMREKLPHDELLRLGREALAVKSATAG